MKTQPANLIALRVQRGFIDSIRVILLLTALLKLFTAAFSAPWLDKQDSVVSFVSVRQLMMLAAVIEVTMVVLLTRGREDPRSLEMVLWLGSVFVGYRILRLLFGGSLECNCLGAVFVRAGDKISIGMLVWMIGGAVTLLVLLKRRYREGENAKPTLSK